MCSRPDKPWAKHSGPILALAAMFLGLCLLLVPACQEAGHMQGRPSLENPVQVKHHYRYYPDSAVYMDIGRRLFFYHEDGKWVAATILPAKVHVDWKSYVILEMNTDKPYEHHAEVSKKYPPKYPMRTLP